MMHILRIEWLKLRKYRAFTVLSMLAVAGVPGINYIVYNFTSDIARAAGADPMAGAIGNAMVGSPFAFPDVFQTVSYIGGFLHILPGLLVILLVSNEYTFRTHRQNVIDGLSRTQFITAKIALAVILAAVMTLTVFLTACLFGAVSGGAFSMAGIRYVGYFFVQSLLYMSVAMVIALLFRRAGIGIGLYFIYAFIAEGVLALLLNGRIYAGSGYFLPLKSADKLIPMPTMLGRMFRPDMPGEAWLLLAAAVWIALCMWFCKRRFERSDL